MVEMYSSRELTYEHDVLDAFDALLRVSSELLFRGSPMLFGVPLCLLDLGLLWSRKSRIPFDLLRRRKTKKNGDWPVFRAWSWVSCVGRVNLSAGRRSPTLTCLTWLDAANGTSVLPQEGRGPPGASWAGWGEWEEIEMSEGMFGFILKHGNKRTKYIPPSDDKSWDQSPLEAATGLLHLYADVAEFWVTEAVLPYVTVLAIWDSDGVKAGEASRDLSGPGDFNGHFSFIKVSRTTLRSRDSLGYDPAWNQNSGSLQGRPGEPSIKPTGTASALVLLRPF
jgi:hypothetical protein